VAPDRDSLFAAIGKLCGMTRDKVISEWGVDPKGKLNSGVIGKPVLRKQGGRSIDGMLDALAAAFLGDDAIESIKERAGIEAEGMGEHAYAAALRKAIDEKIR